MQSRRTAPCDPIPVRPQRLTGRAPRLQLEPLTLLDHWILLDRCRIEKSHPRPRVDHPSRAEGVRATAELALTGSRRESESASERRRFNIPGTTLECESRSLTPTRCWWSRARDRRADARICSTRTAPAFVLTGDREALAGDLGGLVSGQSRCSCNASTSVCCTYRIASTIPGLPIRSSSQHPRSTRRRCATCRRVLRLSVRTHRSAAVASLLDHDLIDHPQRGMRRTARTVGDEADKRILA